MALFNTDLTGTIPDLSNLKSLEVFKVENCNLSGDGHTSLYGVPSLLVLGVAGNEDINGTLAGIEGLTELQELYLGKTRMTGPIPDGIGNTTSPT